MKRDGNLLNSEHIPFNFFGPLANDFGLAKQMINSCLDIDCMEVLNILFEYWPEPQQNYLDDGTKFDVYVEFKDHTGAIIGIGIEVKYSEKSYSPKKKELSKSQDRNSLYWQVTEESGHFVESGLLQLTSNNLRQVWRNHLLGLSMVLNDDIKKFHSITLFPAGNTHFFDVLDAYRNLLIPKFKNYVFPLTYEKFIDSIDGNGELLKWKKYLKKRYLFN
jgi:hypothetical protein